MNLYLLRHGIAVDPSKPGFAKDAERPLTPKGRRRLLQIAKAMAALKISFDVILSSPYVRARQTAEIVAKSLKRRKQLKFTEELTPGGNPKSLIQQLNELRPRPKNILLVGHEPYLSRFIALLTAGNTSMEIDLKKGSLCKLETESLRYARCAALVCLLAPRHMALMTGKRPAR
ncbi:MAG: phosphohistidine phosphatase SixA [Verrucomicrobiales bacterium]|nr:phosphohistidine phosphatase SixA [Verrucomicrobiales bacterium]